MDAKIRSRALQLALVFAALAACDGGSKVGELGDGSRLQLLQVDLGRLVDVYAYQREDVTIGDRRNRANRRIELVARNVVISPNVESQSLFSPSGEVVPTADYEFLPFDKTVGHEELLILWDNRPTWSSGSGGTTPSSEVASFDSALQRAQLGLLPLAPAYRGQDTHTRPIPIVPRNAAIRMRFSAKIPVDATFFETNPSAIQLLEFKGDPAIVQPVDAFRILPYRVVTQGAHVILDTTILGGEGAAGSSSRGLPASADNVTANIRIAIPARGLVSPSFYVQEDAITPLNGVDSAARSSVIRDFRSGNLADGASGRLNEPEPPMIVAPLAMGITAIDTANSIVTLDKREQAFVPIRGRYPFVDGPLDGTTGLPLGPLEAPIFPTLPAGDYLVQVIQVLMPDGTFEAVRLRAEILQNMDVGTVVPDQQLPRLGLAEGQPSGAEQGQLISPARVRLATLIGGKDSLGREHSFQFEPISTPLPPPQSRGKDCTIRARYYEDIPFSSGSFSVTDRPWRNLFTRIDPQPGPGSSAQPNSSVAIEFTKPMDLDQVDNTSNLLITNTHVAAESFEQQLTDPKRATTRVVPSRLSDLSGDGTVLRLQPQMGFYHKNGLAEPYCLHVRLGTAGVTDLAGSPLAIFDRPSNPQVSWSVDFTMVASAADNFVGWHTYRFENQDEDGTPSGSTDIFGQFRLENGRLIGASGVRFSRSADNQNLVSISRINRGECWDVDNDLQVPILPVPVPPPPGLSGWVPLVPSLHPGLLYWQPRMTGVQGPPFVPQVYEYYQFVPQPVGRIVEPHKPQGSRMQMRYIEDDFSLSYRQPSDMAIDVEQLFWSPFQDENVLFDVFDRYTMSLAHCPRRGDERWQLDRDTTMAAALWCVMDCGSMHSGLSETFSENILPGTTLTTVFEDKIYRINPNEAFRDENNIKYVPFPRFDRSYTWRDSRLVSIDANGEVIGLGGARDPGGPAPNADTTANIDSPWITDVRDDFFPGAQWVVDEADFHGDFKHDHDPIALPLVVDFKVFPDGAANGIAGGNNGFQVA
ncbi:MAG TPA: hypothetical protein VFT55_03570, partial [Planctomycetota bacterium]|nr:hypothetical protein [Planctomycetota bacterium]